MTIDEFPVDFFAVLVWGLAMMGVRFGRADYRADEIAKDGAFRAPRRWLHVQKILIGLAVGFIVHDVLTGIMPYPWPWWHDFLVGPAIVLASAAHEYVRPTDPARHTLGEHVTDWLTDGALYSGPAVLFFVRNGRWLAAIAWTIALAGLYRLCRNGARP